ncbi:MAG: glycosyltransferase family 9 protein, partial [Phascolarctobacterium sp.]|nr:glycosyltransferase family 9 protein [Phascolarctobacterium sp.]
MTKVKQRCGTTHSMFKPVWDVFTPLNRKIHAADMYLDVLTHLGVTKLEHNGLEIFPSEEHMAHAEEFWRDHGVFGSDKLVGFNIGSAVVTKRWAPERFAQVADALAAKGYKPVFFGGTMDE